MNTERVTNFRDEFVKLQMEQAYETYRTQFSLLTRVLGILLLANITVVAYAVAHQVAGIFVAGLILPIAAAYVLERANRYMVPVLYVAVTLEQRYGDARDPSLASTFVGFAYPRALERMRKMIVSSGSEGAEVLDPNRNDVRVVRGRRLARILLAGEAAQILALLLLPTLFGWRFF